MVIRDIERTDIPFICETIGCTPVAHPDSLTSEKLSTRATAA
jgi:T-complex protein 1 subunit delta